MKPWLCDILACPIDKYYPLELYIFSFETKEDNFKEIITLYEERDLSQIRVENIVEIQKEKGIINIKDDILIEKSPIDDYLKGIRRSIEEVENLHDKSPFELSKKCFNVIREEIKAKIANFTHTNDFEEIENILPELYFLNKIKTEIEIESGLLFCAQCKRWYPIIETIPQMLPDEYRNEKEEIEFLKTNKDLLDSTFLNQNLKPFNI
jgi:uncharacterized protein YbaR (Trm112 family)